MCFQTPYITGNGLQLTAASPVYIFTTDKIVEGTKRIKMLNESSGLVFWTTELFDDLGRGGWFITHCTMFFLYGRVITYQSEVQNAAYRAKS